MTGMPSRAQLAAAHTLLQGLGIDPAHLAGAAEIKAVPTFAQYVPVVYDAMPDTITRIHYMTYWKKLLDTWPDRRLDEPTVSELQTFVHTVRRQRAQRRNDRGGASAENHCIQALRRLYQHAVDDRYITAADNPAPRLHRAQMPPPNRRALPHNSLAEIVHAVGKGGDDPALDTLILRLHIETACRRGGALALRNQDLDLDRCLVMLREKGGLSRWQPLSPSLAAALAEHHRTRAPSPDQPLGMARNGKPITDHANQRLLRYRNGDPISARRYDVIWHRLARQLPWITDHGISTHWLRHTTLRWVERNYGPAVAKAYAGHSDRNQPNNAIDVYTRATIDEIAHALATLTGEPHPLATDPTNNRQGHEFLIPPRA